MIAPLDPRDSSADLSLRLLGYLLAYLRDHFDAGAIKRVVEAGDVSVEDILLGSRWVSIERFEAILAAARALFPDDESFKKACAYKLTDIPGPVKFCMGAISPVLAYDFGCKNMRIVSSISTFRAELLGHGRVRIRYETTKPESRLLCLSRQAQMEQLPTLWGQPAAHVVETSCVSCGDPTCGYDIHVYEQRRWLPSAVGALLGVAACLGWILMRGAGVPGVTWAFCALLGFLGGHLYELRRATASNRLAHEEIGAAYVQAGRDEANARRELFVLMQRQSTWSQLMESQVVGRTQMLQDMTSEIERLHASRIIKLRGAGGPIGSPLERVHANLQELRALTALREPEAAGAIDQIQSELQAVSRTLKELVRTASSGTNLIELLPENLDTDGLVEELRTRLRALVHQPDVRVSVFAAREAPGRIRTDIALFNRVVDNLLLNAALQTERGSIVVEVTGTPGFLTVKVSDSGPGMEEERLARMFRPIQRTVVGQTVGAGLSVVVQLLALLGGKLEVMSAPGRGATFWAHIPVDSDAMRNAPPETEGTDGKSVADSVERIVTVRRWSQG